MSLYLTVYQTKPPDYEAVTEKAGELGIKLEFGGGRKTKGGESPNAQITLNLKEIKSKILVSRTGKIQIYYPSKPCLEKCITALLSVYIPVIEKSELQCQGPKDPLSKAFELRTTDNWNGTGKTLFEAIVVTHQWLDSNTGEYTFVMPDDDGRIIPPKGSSFEYAGNCRIIIKTTDKEDEKGNRIITGEKILWKAMKELRRIHREHRLTPADIKRAQSRPQTYNQRKTLEDVDLIFEV